MFCLKSIETDLIEPLIDILLYFTPNALTVTQKSFHFLNTFNINRMVIVFFIDYMWHYNDQDLFL